MSPFEPPLGAFGLPPLGGQLGPAPEHFIVEEIPAYEPTGSGDHLYVWLQKTGFNTADAARKLGRAARVPERDVGYAGLKDRHAVTRQWFSLPASARPPEEWELEDGLVVLETSRHKNKLRTGHLRGNRFVLTLTGVPEGGLDRARAYGAAFRERGVGNYFGPQRFGRDGSNWDKALAWLGRAEAGGREERDQRDQRPDGRSGRRGGGRSRFDEKMLPSVIQSEIFNRYLAARLERPERLLDGEVVRLEGSSRHFVVEDVERELPRLLEGDVHLTGALVGPKTVQSRGAALELERSILEELGFGEAELERLGRAAPGARRDLLLRPGDFSVEEPEPGQLELRFTLDAGSYATQILRELTHGAWLESRAPMVRPED